MAHEENGAAAAEVGGYPAQRTLLLVAAAMLGLFAFTALLAGWYHRERLAFAQKDFERAVKLESTGHEREALQHYQRALSTSRDNSRYRLAMALFLMKTGRLNEAAIYFHELLRADPSNAVPNLMLARVAQRQGQAAAAVDYYNRAIYGRWPETPEQNRLEARWELVQLLGKSGSAKQIVAELIQIADQAPNDFATRKRVGQMLLRFGAPTQAIEIFRELMRQGDRDAAVYAGHGSSEVALGNYRDAQRSFSRAIRLDPHDKTARKNLALVEEVLGLDPTLRDLSATERWRRSRVLLSQTVSAVEACLGSATNAPARDLLATARKLLARQPRRPPSGDATEHNISLAEQLWSARAAACGPVSDTGGALTRVLARLSR